MLKLYKYSPRPVSCGAPYAKLCKIQAIAMQKYYELKMGKGLRFTTKLVWALSFLPAAGAVFCAWYKLNPLASGPGGHCPVPWAALPFFLAAPALVMFFRRFAPEGCILNDIELIIDRKSKPIIIPLMEITEARLLTEKELKWTIKLNGSEGFYGYFGLFWSKQLGKFKMYATRRKNLVAVRTAKALYVLSPEDIEDFLTNLKKLTAR